MGGETGIWEEKQKWRKQTGNMTSVREGDEVARVTRLGSLSSIGGRL